MGAMVESTERRSKGILSKLFDAADAIKIEIQEAK